MSFQNIYCIIKLSELDYYQQHGEGSERLQRLSEKKRREIEESHDNQLVFVEKLNRLNKELKMGIVMVPESKLDDIEPTREDLVLTAGGDGTFLSTAQRFPQATLLGMNSDFEPQAGAGSHGALTKINRTNLASRMKAIQAGHYGIELWNRLQVSINGELIDRYAVNDIYFGQRISYKTCNIIVEQSGESEEFNCSGLLCCTGMGSHAWHYNAGGSPFSNDLDAFGFRVLFPNMKHPLKFTSGIVSQRNQVTVTPERDHYVLSFDSQGDVIETEMGDKIIIHLAKDRAIRILLFNDE